MSSSENLMNTLFQLVPEHQKQIAVELIRNCIAEEYQVSRDEIPELFANESIESGIRWYKHYIELKK